MEEALFTFSPHNTATAQAAWVSGAAALGALAGMAAMLGKKAQGRRRHQNTLVAMLLFFAFLISGSAAFFSWWKIRKTGPVVIYADAVETPFGKAPFEAIKDAYIHADSQPSVVNPGRAVRTTRIMVIEERNGKAHAMSEEDYPIEEMLPALRNTFSRWRQSRER
ncbi:MAG: hypothetical protein J5I98_33470 [Phaeodactylibacter sp.]|nr:hypothetical protein [Phaeodactylibacter sp.]